MALARGVRRTSPQLDNAECRPVSREISWPYGRFGRSPARIASPAPHSSTSPVANNVMMASS